MKFTPKVGLLKIEYTLSSYKWVIITIFCSLLLPYGQKCTNILYERIYVLRILIFVVYWSTTFFPSRVCDSLISTFLFCVLFVLKCNLLVSAPSRRHFDEFDNISYACQMIIKPRDTNKNIGSTLFSSNILFSFFSSFIYIFFAINLVRVQIFSCWFVFFSTLYLLCSFIVPKNAFGHRDSNIDGHAFHVIRELTVVIIIFFNDS